MTYKIIQCFKSQTKRLKKLNVIYTSSILHRASHWDFILTLIFTGNTSMYFFPNDKSFRETTCRFVYMFFFSNYAKKYMNLKMRCNKTVCHFIYYCDKRPQNRRNDVLFLEKTCHFGKRHLLNIGFYITMGWEHTNA